MWQVQAKLPLWRDFCATLGLPASPKDCRFTGAPVLQSFPPKVLLPRLSEPAWARALLSSLLPRSRNLKVGLFWPLGLYLTMQSIFDWKIKLSGLPSNSWVALMEFNEDLSLVPPLRKIWEKLQSSSHVWRYFRDFRVLSLSNGITDWK